MTTRPLRRVARVTSDFLPLLEFCSDHGVRVEVAAFDDAASMILRQSCDLFVNLSLVEGIRG